MTRQNSLFPGLLVCFGLAVPAFLAGRLFPLVGSAVFAILFGLAAGPFMRAPRLAPGIRFAGRGVLKGSIVLLGFRMRLDEVAAVGARSSAVMLCTAAASFAAAAVLARVLRVPGKQAALIGVGTSICGGSAIAACAPAIEAEEEDVARAVSTIFLFNVAAALVFPPLGRLIGLSDEGFGLWAGTAVNDTSSVIAAASAWSEYAGNATALDLATVVKLARTLLIVPVAVVLSLVHAKRSGKGAGGVDLVRVFPWFALGFLAAAAINTYFPLPAAATDALGFCSAFLIAAAMAAIGASTGAASLAKGGARPVLLGLGCWIVVSLVSLAVQFATASA